MKAGDASIRSDSEASRSACGPDADPAGLYGEEVPGRTDGGIDVAEARGRSPISRPAPAPLLVIVIDWGDWQGKKRRVSAGAGSGV